MENFLSDSALVTAAIAFAGALAYKLIDILFTYLKNKALKTETLTDDEFLANIEQIVKDAIKKKTAK